MITKNTHFVENIIAFQIILEDIGQNWLFSIGLPNLIKEMEEIQFQIIFKTITVNICKTYILQITTCLEKIFYQE